MAEISYFMRCLSNSFGSLHSFAKFVSDPAFSCIFNSDAFCNLGETIEQRISEVTMNYGQGQAEGGERGDGPGHPRQWHRKREITKNLF